MTTKIKKTNRNKEVFVWIGSLILVIIVSVLSAYMVKGIESMQESSEGNGVVDKILYGQDGKTDGSMLVEFPDNITDEYIFFEDRVVKRYEYNENDILETQKLLSEIFAEIPNEIDSALMLVPDRIAFEEIEGISDSDDVKKAFDEIYSGIDNNVEKIRLLNKLNEKSDEYIYFRTDDSWTALGAYYAAKEYLAYKNKDIIPLEEYEERRFLNYVGTMRVVDGADYLSDYNDYISYYIKKDSKNNQYITERISSSEFNEYQTRVLSLSRRGKDIFIGRVFSHTIIEGDADNGECIMILGDSQAKLFAPWMIPYYSTICLVDSAFFNGGYEQMQLLISDLKVTDILVMESVDMFGQSTRNKRIKELLVQPIVEGRKE